MCGVAGAGKTTYAQSLEAVGYVRLSIDEVIWDRFGRFGVDYDPARYDEYTAIAEAALRERLIALVRQGRDVVVDRSFWQRAARDEYKAFLAEAGAQSELVYLKLEREQLRERLAARAARFDANAAFPITDDILDRFLAGFEEPHGEGETVIRSSQTRAQDHAPPAHKRSS
jgi:predicted kinase